MTKQLTWRLTGAITFACIVGFGVSYYAYYVEKMTEENESYEASCDISEHVSCTKTFTSDYGKGFGIIPETSPLYMPNSVYGLIFYALVATLNMFNKYSTSTVVVTLGVISNLTTIYLAYILYIMNNVCVICVSTYIINAIILLLAVKKHQKLFRDGTIKKKKKKRRSE